MKKLLSILAISSLIATTSVNVLACNNENIDKNITPDPIPKYAKTRFSDEEYDNAIGTFSFEQNGEGITLTSKEQKTAFGWNSSTEKAYSINLSREVMEDIFILPFDIDLETSIEKPYDNEIISLITFNPEQIESQGSYWSKFWDKVGDKSKEGTVVNDRKHAEILRSTKWQSIAIHYRKNVIKKNYEVESKDGRTMMMTVFIVVQDYLISSYLFNGRQMFENFIRDEKYKDFFGNVEFSLIEGAAYLAVITSEPFDFFKEINGVSMALNYKDYFEKLFNDLREKILELNPNYEDYLFKLDYSKLSNGDNTNYTGVSLFINATRKKGLNINYNMYIVISGPKKTV
ncbi:hypothetical protein SCHIN_v1c04410 [Spiroplasma chinense]|uniref:Lipoprotein n=1 Tax=Spiroplasma chinense TaxID=216932 RepID=A0A5B9Y3D2_9MOLU|nr:hypothetical protein [Spiroplasma chinense]QEH61638.1 hypothetical protein SCHIN_v1c04410 [Spiroplasma chinense]